MKSIKSTHKTLLFSLMISLILSACSRSLPKPHPALEFPATSTTFQDMVSDSQQPSASTPIATNSPIQFDLRIIETGYMGDDIFIVVLLVPPSLQGIEMDAWVDDLSYHCIYQENKTILYCSGPIIRAQPAILTLKPVTADFPVIEIPLEIVDIDHFLD